MNTILKKIAAGLISAAMIFSPLSMKMTDISTGAIVTPSYDSSQRSQVCGDNIFSKPGETIEWSLQIKNIPDFAISGIRVFLPEYITPVIEEINPKFDSMSTLSTKVIYNDEKKLLGIHAIGTKSYEEACIIITLYLNVSEKAVPEKTLPIQIEIDRIVDARENSIDNVEVIDGSITIIWPKAESGTCGNNLNWTLDEYDKLSISGKGDMDSWQCDSSKGIDTVPWKRFRNRIKSLAISNGVTSIGDSAFSSCTELTSVSFPDSLTSIGDYAFSNCEKLTSVTFSKNITNIGDAAFKGCTSLTSVTLPNSLTSTGNSAFSSCTELTSVSFPDSLTSIGDYAFSNCEKLTSVTFSKNITNIGDAAFKGCTSLTSVTLPNSLTSIGNSAFYHCSGLTSVTLPDGLTSVGNSAFTDCTSLNSVILPESIMSIGDSAFAKCRNLELIIIPNCTVSIGTNALFNCIKLTVLGLPDSSAKTYVKPYGILFQILGDANCNGVLDQEDTALIKEEYNNTSQDNESILSVQGKINADIDVNGIIDSNDLSWVLNHFSEFGVTTITTTTTSTTTKLTTTMQSTTKPALKIDKTSFTMTNGDQYTIIANRNDITYKSNNPDVAIVSSNGIITAVGVGQATISVIDSELNVVQIKVEVTAVTTSAFTVPKVTTTATTTTTSTTTKLTTTTQSTTTTTTKPALKIEKTSFTMTNGDQYTIIANRNDVTYKSNNPDVAIVSSNGIITAVGVGPATISVIDSESNVVQIKVEVTAFVTPPETDYLVGDVNNDGEIGIEDAQLTLNAYVDIMADKERPLTAEQVKAADVNDDNVISVEDAQFILMYYVQNTVADIPTTWEELLK